MCVKRHGEGTKKRKTAARGRTKELEGGETGVREGGDEVERDKRDRGGSNDSGSDSGSNDNSNSGSGSGSTGRFPPVHKPPPLLIPPENPET